LAWRPPQPPPVEKLPPERGPKKARIGGRLVAALAGVALLISGGVGVWRALNDPTGTSSPFGALAVLIPAVVMIRYAFTGVIKVS
jgi:hypothetical protein